MLKPLALLLAASGFCLTLCCLVLGEEKRVPALLAMAIVLPPAWLSMLAVLIIAKRWPLLGVTSIVVGSGLRLGWAVVAVIYLRGESERLGTTPAALAGWTTTFYLLLLVLETGLLWRRLNPGAVPKGKVIDGL